MIIDTHTGGGLPYAFGRLKRNKAIHPGEYADPADGFARLYTASPGSISIRGCSGRGPCGFCATLPAPTR